MKSRFKKLITLTILLLCVAKIYAQIPVHCGFEAHNTSVIPQQLLDKISRLQSSYTVKDQAVGKNGSPLAEDLTVYDIPIVVHILEDGTQAMSSNSLTNTYIQDWIQYTNQLLAGKYSSQSVALPFRFVLAKYDENCQATTGILRVNLSQESRYVNYGVKNGGSSQALSTTEVFAHSEWDPQQYVNIYIANKIPNNSASGFASDPLARSNSYLFIFRPYVGATHNVYNTTAAHEFGHILGLYHTFKGSANSSECPSNSNCLSSGDFVCDTDPQPFEALGCAPQNHNPCTGAAYTENTLNNIMNYSYCITNLFTQGQADRTRAIFLSTRRHLLNSKAIGTSQPTPPPVLAALKASCNSSITQANLNNFNPGAVFVSLADIYNPSTYYQKGSTNWEAGYHVDYSIPRTYKCISNKRFYTQVIAGKSYPLKLELETTKPQHIRAYLDINNDGILSESELLFSAAAITSLKFATQVSIPSTAVRGQALRLRLIVQEQNTAVLNTACVVGHGQIEDYSVEILNPTN